MAVPQASRYELHRPSIIIEQSHKRSSIIYIKSSDATHTQYDSALTHSADTQDNEPPLSHLQPMPQTSPSIPVAGGSAPVAQPANYSLPIRRTITLTADLSPNQDSELPSKSPLRPLSLLQGRNPNTPKESSMGVVDKKTLPLNTPKRSTKSTTSSGMPTTEKKSKKSTTSSQNQDENRIEGDKPDTPKSGLRPLKMARSATSKARGILRKQEVLPDVVVRPPSTSTHHGFSYSFRRGVA